ncbi:MAG: YafY family transcriptional regulator [Planctomycetes bacterium]|nr:YafY family transcriptional regulator [Planctomycetota bacterium]
MRRADRLFRIVQRLRADRVVTAATLARELSVSERTVYRDVADLVGCGVPIEGAAGVGYSLPRGFELPPLMFTREEVDALVLGLRMVSAFSDDELAARADDVLGKVAAALPRPLRRRLDAVDLFAPRGFVSPSMLAPLGTLRRAVDERRLLSFVYTRGDGARSARHVRPLGLFFWGRTWTLLAWCELRDDFRSFRPDRITSLVLRDEVVPDEPGKDMAEFLRRMRAAGELPDDDGDAARA